MKEAAGEANLTILAVVLIAIVTGGLWEGGDCNGADATYAECIA